MIPDAADGAPQRTRSPAIRRGCLWPLFILCTVGAVLVGGGLVVNFIGQTVPVRMKPQSTDDPKVRALALGHQYEQQ